jgi:TolB-like protein
LPTLQKHKTITIAVLPFQVNCEDKRLQNLFLGFVDDLIINFSKFVGLSVISSFSSRRIKDISNQEELDKLGANFFIYGSVRCIKDDARISIQLVKAKDQSLVFAGQYEESTSSLFEAQDGIIQQIVAVLQEKIDHNLLSHSYKKNPVELAAYENYLLGMNTLYKGSIDNDRKAREYFETALEIDPNYSLAYTGIALSYFNFWSCVLWNRWDNSMKGAHKYALKAIDLDPNDYLALGILGRTYVYKGEYDLAEHHLRRSLRMNANDASNLLRVSFSLMLCGYAQDAINLYLKAIKINPLHKDIYYAYGSNYYLQLGDFEKSIALSKKVTLEAWTDFPAWVAAAHLQLKNYDEVWKCWEVFIKLFKKEAYSGKKNITEAALDWLLILNPFKEFTYLTPLIDFIRTQKKLPKNPNLKTPSKNGNSFLLRGNVWEMSYQGNSIILKDAKGFHDIYKLLANPKEEFHCLDLMGAGVDENHTTESIDQKAKSQYVDRIKELQVDIQEAENMNQIEEVSKLRAEYDSILDYLSNSLGLSGKSRKVGSTVEKARSAVTWRIRSTIKKISEVHPELGNHFSKSIKTGTQCSYSPETNIEWNL